MATSITKSHAIATGSGGDDVKTGFDSVNSEVTLIYAWLTKIIKSNVGTSAPAITYPNMLWADTTNSLLKMRNTSDSDWITIGTLDTANLGLATSTAGDLSMSNLLKNGFVLNGIVASKNGGTATQLDISAGDAILYQLSTTSYLERAISATNKTTSVASTTYYLDLEPDGTLSWGVNHSSDANYIAIAEVTTDSGGDIDTVTDKRETSFCFYQPGLKVNGSKVWTDANDELDTSEDGYCKLPNGLTFMWGTEETTTSGEESFNFPTSFSNACRGVTTTLQEVNATHTLAVISWSKTAFTINRSSDCGDGSFSYFAIGY